MKESMKMELFTMKIQTTATTSEMKLEKNDQDAREWKEIQREPRERKKIRCVKVSVALH